MSVYKYVTVECDAGYARGFEHTRSCFSRLVTGHEGIHNARMAARTQGWTYHKGKDLCPVHSGHATTGHELSDGSMHYDWLPEHAHFEDNY